MALKDVYRAPVSVYNSTGNKEIALMLRQRYDQNRDRTDLLQQMMASIQTRPGDAALKDNVISRINAELGNVIETGRYEMATAALGSSENIFKTDRGLLLAQQSYNNRQSEIQWMQDNAPTETILDWGKDDYNTGVSYYQNEENGEWIENVYQPQAEVMEDYGKEQRAMLKTISADWTGISSAKADDIAFMLTQVYLSTDNRVGAQQYRYLTQLGPFKDMADPEEQATAAFNHIYDQFRSLTHQYVHTKKAENKKNNVKSLNTKISEGLEGYWAGKHLDKGNVSMDLDSSNPDYMEHVENVYWDFNPNTPLDQRSLMETIEILKASDRAALREQGKNEAEINDYLLLKYGTGDHPDYAPLMGLVDYLTVSTESDIFGDSFGKLNPGVGEQVMEGVAAGGTAWTLGKGAEIAWNFAFGKKIKLANKLFKFTFFGKTAFDVATENLLDEYNNVRDANWGIGLNDEQKLMRILSDVEWVNEKLNTNYSLDDPYYQQAINNALGFLEYRKTMGGDEFDNIVADYKGIVFEGMKYGSADGADVNAANSVLNQFNVTDFRLLGYGDLDQEGWVDVLDLDPKYKKERIPIDFSAFITGDLQLGIDNALELNIGGKTVIVRSKANNPEGAEVNSIEEIIARQIGMKVFNVENSAQRILQTWKQNGQIEKITPEVVEMAIAEGYKREGVQTKQEGDEIAMDDATAILAAQQWIINQFNAAYPEIYNNFEKQLREANPDATEVQIQSQARHMTYMIMNDDQYWDMEFQTKKEELDMQYNTGQITYQVYTAELNRAKENAKGKSWMKQSMTY